MAEVVLYHHAQGLTEGIEALAEELRSADHSVHVPDMYEGNTFEDLDEGIAYARQTGFGTVQQRGLDAVVRRPSAGAHAPSRRPKEHVTADPGCPA